MNFQRRNFRCRWHFKKKASFSLNSEGWVTRKLDLARILGWMYHRTETTSQNVCWIQNSKFIFEFKDSFWVNFKRAKNNQNNKRKNKDGVGEQMAFQVWFVVIPFIWISKGSYKFHLHEKKRKFQIWSETVTKKVILCSFRSTVNTYTPTSLHAREASIISPSQYCSTCDSVPIKAT